jgi:hypothetical protein
VIRLLPATSLALCDRFALDLDPPSVRPSSIVTHGDVRRLPSIDQISRNKAYAT